jgi:hypothetical protein
VADRDEAEDLTVCYLKGGNVSHASVIVAVSAKKLEDFDGDVQEAVSFEMEPFNEDRPHDGGWFADGSRWDWWVIGGRFEERLLGKDVCLRSELDEEKLRIANGVHAMDLWMKFQSDPGKNDAFTRSIIYGLEENDTVETVVSRHERNLLTAFAFLKDRKWCERERLGWFGTTTKTECEVKAVEKGEEFEGRCLVKDETTSAQIVTFSGPDDTKDRWDDLYWPRFIRGLPPDTTLVVVDYHV